MKGSRILVYFWNRSAKRHVFFHMFLRMWDLYDQWDAMRLNGPAPQKQCSAVGSNFVVTPSCVMYMGFLGFEVVDVVVLMPDRHVSSEHGVPTEGVATFDVIM